MRKRNLKKTILAAALAVPVAFSYPGWAVRAQEDEMVSTETEAQKVMQDNTAPEEAECEENPAYDEMDGAETDSTETDSTEADRNVSEEEKFFQSGLIANEDGEFLSSLEEMETSGEDSMFFQDGLEVLEDGSTDDLIDAYVAPENYAQEGTPVREGKGGFTAVANGSTLFSSKYTRLGWNADTQVYSWNNAGNDVISGMKQGAMVEGPYFVPLNNNAKGKFGFRVTHVGYNKEANTKVDLLLTCNNYQDYTYDYKGNKITGIYPMFGVSNSNELWISFKDELSAQEIKIDIVKSGTDIPVAGNYRFRWLDIDLYQRFGINLQNGSIGHRYATTDSVVNVVKKTLFSKNFEVLTAPAPAVDGEIPQNTVVYELDNSSGFYLAILRPGCGAYSIETASRIKSVFADVQTGTCKTSAGLNWDAKGYGPVEYPGLVKKTGNTLASQGTSNTLSDSTSEFYYTLQTDIPEEHSAYYYSSCEVSDTLPAGVDFAGYAAVKMLPSENDVTSWFSISTDGDVINFQATQAALSQADFYGKTYEFQIKVRMDPTEITPVYSGDSYRYEVKNKASITCQHINGLAGTSWSDEVTTDCTRYKNKVVNASVKKYTANLQDGVWREDLLLPGPDSEYKYKLNINVPDNEFGGYMTRMEIADTLPAGAELTAATAEVYENGQNRVDGRFQISVNGKNITLKATEAALGDRGFYGKSYDVIFNARMVPGEISCTYNGTVASYVTSNHFTVTTQHKGDSQAVTITSNNVADRASVNRTEPKNPQKWILRENQRIVTAEYNGRDFESVFEIVQEIPSNKREWKISKFKIQDTLADCFELKGVQIYLDQTVEASFGASDSVRGDWSLNVAGNSITLSSVAELPERCYGKSVRLLLTVGLKSNSDLQQYYVANQDPDVLEAHIYNIATSTFNWIGGEPSSTSKNTEKTRVIVKEKVPKGHITIRKVDETGKALQNGKFQITALEDIRSASGNILLRAGTVADTIVTDRNGTAISKDIYLGKYKVSEVRPPEGYAISRQVFEANLSKTEPEKAILVRNQKMHLYIKKVTETEEAGGNRPPIEGVKFRLWESSANADSAGTTYTTNKNGLIKLEGLSPATYCIQETAVPAGYVLDNTVHKFTVDANGLVKNEQGYTMVIENRYIKAEFLKTDKVTGEAVAGAVMQLTDKSGKVIDTWTSGKTAHRINKLPAGEYVLTEITAPSGYKKGKPVICTVKSTSGVQKFQMTDVKMVTLTINKILHGDEIVWGQGNPAFTFTVKGTDLDGEERIYSKTVEFTKENTDTRADVSKRAVFALPAGKYQVQESKVMRYKLEKIDQVVNGTVQGNTVQFDLSGNQNGTASFTNKKSGDGLLTDTDYVRNIVIPEK